MGRLSAISVFLCKSVSMGRLYGPAGRLNNKNGGFRPGQISPASSWMCSRPSGSPAGRSGCVSAALSLCAATHPLHTKFTNILGASISETTMRPNPRSGCASAAAGSAWSPPRARPCAGRWRSACRCRRASPRSTRTQAPRGRRGRSLGPRAAPSPKTAARLGLYPIATFQYSSTNLYQVFYHIRYLFFESDNRIYP